MTFRRDESNKPVPVPKGFSLLTTLAGHTGRLSTVTVAPDGRSAVSGSQDGTIAIWDLVSGRITRTLTGHTDYVTSVAVAPDGRSFITGSVDNTVKVWDFGAGQLLRSLKGHAAAVTSVAVTPDGRSVVSASDDKTVRVWDIKSGAIRHSLGGRGPLNSVAVTPDGELIISGCGTTVRLWRRDSGKLFRTLEGHARYVTSVGVTADGLWIVSASEDSTLRVWDALTGRHLRTLEGHNNAVAGLALTRHWAASDSVDRTVRVWDLATGASLATLPSGGPASPSDSRVAFAPGGALLTAVGADSGHAIQVWEVDWASLASGPDSRETTRYRNAKVVLVGDTGVGKSGLGAVLAGQPFEPTDSTHGRKVWLFESKKEPLSDGGHQIRETMLWDLAGQPGYRLVHQLNIDQAVVALVLVDARSETDPLGPAEYWARAIDQASSAIPITKFLVVARVDRGGLAVNAAALQHFAQRFGFAGVFQTSAKTGEGVPPLAQAIRESVRWDEMEEVTSTQLFTSIKEFLRKEKERGDQALVERLEALFERFASGSPTLSTLADFRTCVSRLQAAGLVEVLLFSVLDKSDAEKVEYVLLQPEYVDAYASAAVMTARDDPRGIGHVLESDLLAGRLRLDAAERIPDERIERLVLAVTIERLLNHDIALRERLPDGDYLVFPSEYTRTAPYPRRNAPGVAFDFQGAIRAIFTTLVVRLAHHGDFKNVEFYRDAASYETRTQERGERGGRCAVVLDETAPGQGRMSVYFEDDPGQAEQQSFLHFVRQHLEAKAKPDSVHLHRLYFCRACGHALDELAVQNRLKQGSKDIGCPNCDERTPLFDLLIAGDAEARADAQRMDTDADTAHSRQLAATAIEGKKRIGEYDVFLSYSTKDRDKVVALAEALVALGIRPWLDVWDLVPGQPWQVGLNEAIQHVNAAAVCVGPSGTGPWQDHEVMAFIRQFVKRESPVIPVLLPGAASHVALPPLLDSFLWVDVREFSLANPRPLANLVAGIFGRRPRAMDPERLADQVAAILAAPPARPVPDEAQEIVLPVNRGALNDTEVEALRQQTARLLVPALPDRSRAVHHREWVH